MEYREKCIGLRTEWGLEEEKFYQKARVETGLLREIRGKRKIKVLCDLK